MTSTPRLEPALMPDTTRSSRPSQSSHTASFTQSAGLPSTLQPRSLPPTVTCCVISGAMKVIAWAAPLCPDSGATISISPSDPEFPSRVAPGDIVVGGDDFAAGTEDDTGVRAMLAAGIAATVAYSFDPQFARFALERGLPAVEVNESLAIHTGERLRVDLESSRVVNMSSGDRYPIRNVDDAFLERFRPTDA